MAAFGLDFRNAKSKWLYREAAAPSFWWAIAMAVALFLVHALVFQSLTTLMAYKLVFGGSFSTAFELVSGKPSSEITKSAIIGLAPAAIMTSVVALFMAKFLGGGRSIGLPLHYPSLGFAGWVATLVLFVVAMYLTFLLVFLVFQVDPQSYSPAGGLENAGENAGMVERTMAELGKNWLMYALALPGVMVFVPIAEELIFRGVLFNALLHSPVGKFGAVVITAGLFALVHRLSPAPWLFVGVIFVMGLILGSLLLRFGSLWVPIACHVVWNTLSSLMIGLQS